MKTQRNIKNSNYPRRDITSGTCNPYVDVPMHLLMLGVVKSVLLKIGVWLRYRSQKTMFLTTSNNILGKVKELNVEWCKILEYPSTDKFGGWISENFMAMSRLAQWFYSLLNFLPESESYVDPTTPYMKWNKTLNGSWLEARGLSKVGTAGDLKNRVSKYFLENNIPPIVVKNECKKENILDMVRHMSLMIHLFMSFELRHHEVNVLEATIRLFLIKYDIVDGGITKKDTPSWITQYNFLCLLNLPATVRQYGNVRNLWEGGSNGEGYLKRVKNELKPGLVNQWQKWSLRNLLQDKLYDEWMKEKKDELGNTKSNLRTECKVYGNRKKALGEIGSGNPFSGIMLCTSKQEIVSYYICFRGAGTIKKLRIKVSTESTYYNGLNYNRIKKTKEISNMDNENKDIVGVIFLPKLGNSGYVHSDENTYFIIRSDWT